MIDLRGLGHFPRRALGLGEGGSWLGVHPAEDATRANVVAYAFTTWCTVLCFVFVNAAQPGILRKILPAAGQDRASAHGEGGMQEAGNASGSIVFWAEITVILLSPIWGALADRLGGRFVNVSGFIFAAVGLAVIPSCGSIEALTAARCLFSVGGAALGSTLSSILAHTVLQEDKGKGAALAGTAASFGAIFAALCLLRIPAIAEQMAAAGAPGGIGVPGASYIHCAYYTTTCFAMFGAAVGAWHLYDKKMEGVAPAAQAAQAESDGQRIQQEQREVGLVFRLSEVSNVSISRVRECYAILRADAGMCLALAAALQARGDASTVTVFLALWVNEYSKDVNGMSGAQAARAAGAATGLVYTLSLLSGPPWGIVVDRLGDARSLMLAAAISGVTYSAVSLLTNPTSGLGYLFGAGMGVAEIAMNISSQSMIARRSPPGARGLIGGIASIASGVGILLTGKLGGLAYDVSPGGPFLVQGVLSFAVCAAAAILHARGKLGMPKHRGEESKGDAGEGGCGGGGGGMAALDSLNVDVPCDGDEPRDVEQHGGGGQDAEGGGNEHYGGVAREEGQADMERIKEDYSKGGTNEESRGGGDLRRQWDRGEETKGK